jgi:hypothetical protein
VSTNDQQTLREVASRAAQRQARAKLLEAARRREIDVVLVTDRGCFHHLPEEARSRYATEVARFLKPGGALLLRGSRVPQTPFIPITVESLARHMPAAGLNLIKLQETDLVATGRAIPGYLCLVRKGAVP